MEDYQIYQDEINKLLRFYNITVVQWSKSACGWARKSNRTIKIPPPTTIENFLICLHEIRHITQPGGPNYVMEYDAERWAIDYAQKLGFDTKSYERRAKMYVLKNIAKGINRGLRVHRVKPEILNWLPIDITEWEGNKVYLYAGDKKRSRDNIIIEMRKPNNYRPFRKTRYQWNNLINETEITELPV